MFSRLNRLRQRQPQKDEFLALLYPCEPLEIQLQSLHRGIDNARIDVALCPIFSIKATQLVRGILQHCAVLNDLSRQVAKPKKADMDAFLKAYADMMDATVARAHKASSPDQVQLLQLSVMRFLLRLINEELDRLRDGMQRSRGGAVGQSDRRALELHECMVTLAKQRNRLRNTVLQQLFGRIIKLEARSLRVTRKSVLGISWPLPRPVLCNPMLQQPLPWEDGQRIAPYLPLCVDYFDQTNRLLSEIFSAYLPSWALACDGEGCLPCSRDELKNRAQLRKPQSGVDGALEAEALLRSSLQPEEYLQGQFCWLDMPDNFELLTSQAVLQKALSDQNRKQLPAGWQDFQRDVKRRICRQLKQLGLVPQILAAYGACSVIRGLEQHLPASLVQQYLSGELSRKELPRQLTGLQIDPLSAAAVTKKLELARNRIKQISPEEQEQLLLSYIKDFLVFRRDLKNAFLTYQAMDQLSLLSRAEDVELSSANSTLYRFVSTHENVPIKQQICKHVILKADIRGSTTITSGLVAKGLNPATYFSLNLFKPINELLGSYGATKVFVEGDAIILSILENEGAARPSVAWACGLAQKILEVVDVQNTRNRQYGLPALELGLGIAFSAEPPTFLYDDEKQIMISSAINRADQLSSCSAALRRSFSRQRGVEVMTSADPGLFEKEYPDRLLRFNVDGIELDKAAFDRLKTELALKCLTPDASLACDALTLYVGRYSDNRGVKHWLIIRKGAVHFWADSCTGPEEQKGRCFYEVLTSHEVLTWVKSKMDRRHRKRIMDPDVVLSGSTLPLSNFR